MAFSLYYDAKRGHQISQLEKNDCDEIINKYCFEYDFDLKVEDFGVYEVDYNSDIIFSGATKLPDSEPELMFDVANYWLECLTEITYILGECQWNVTFEDVDLLFDSEVGWRFTTDEEYE